MMITRFGKFLKKNKNLTAAVLFTGLLWFFISLRFDFYYDLNDDFWIKEILSGAYTGQPSGYAIQLLYPLSWLLAALYLLLPGMEWFGFFLNLCQFGSIALMLLRAFKKWDNIGKKTIAAVAAACFVFSLLLYPLVYVQYTTAAGMLGAAAIFWFLTSDTGLSFKAFWKDNIPALLLLWTSFCLRSEMMLLLLPLLAVAGISRWMQERPLFTRKTLLKYLGLCGILAAGMAVVFGMDAYAYQKDGWKEFRQFFDARTQVYDFWGYPDYESNQKFYESIGMTEASWRLLDNYNFGADDSIDAKTMQAVADYAKSQGEGPFKKNLSEGIWLLSKHMGAVSNQPQIQVQGDFPWNYMFLILTAALFIKGIIRKDRRLCMLQAILLAGTGWGLWLFLVLRDRVVERISLPLYLAMTVTALLLLLDEGSRMKKTDSKPGKVLSERDEKFQFAKMKGKKGSFAAAAGMLVLLLFIVLIPSSWQRSVSEKERREEINAGAWQIDAYCASYPNLLFLEDVYSTTAYSEKIYTGEEAGQLSNQDLMGGWVNKSPLTEYKLSLFGSSSMQEALSGNPKVRVLIEKEKDISWLEDILSEKGVSAKALKVDAIGEVMDVYQIVVTGGEETLEISSAVRSE